MLVAKFSQKAVSWAGASVSLPKSGLAPKTKAKSSFLRRSKKVCVPALFNVRVRTVITLAEDLPEENHTPTHVTDLRGFDQTVEFLTGVPQAQLNRKVQIYRPTPKTVQSGNKHTKVYMKFIRQADRVNEGLMGWTSTTDPTGNLTLSFDNDAAAIAFAQRNGLDYELIYNPGQERVRQPKDYAQNFRFRDPKQVHNEDFDL